MKEKSFFKILYRFPEFSGDLVQDNYLIVNFIFWSELTTLVLYQREGHVCNLCLLKYTQTHSVHHLTTHSFSRLPTSSAHSSGHAPCSQWIHPEFIPDSTLRLPMSQFDKSLHHLTSAWFWSTKIKIEKQSSLQSSPSLTQHTASITFSQQLATFCSHPPFPSYYNIPQKTKTAFLQ